MKGMELMLQRLIEGVMPNFREQMENSGKMAAETIAHFDRKLDLILANQSAIMRKIGLVEAATVEIEQSLIEGNGHDGSIDGAGSAGADTDADGNGAGGDGAGQRGDDGGSAAGGNADDHGSAGAGR